MTDIQMVLCLIPFGVACYCPVTNTIAPNSMAAYSVESIFKIRILNIKEKIVFLCVKIFIKLIILR